MGTTKTRSLCSLTRNQDNRTQQMRRHMHLTEAQLMSLNVTDLKEYPINDVFQHLRPQNKRTYK